MDSAAEAASPGLATSQGDAYRASGDAGILEGHLGWSRTGHSGVNRIEVNGLIAAAFRHRTSRAGVPHLHTHVLAANMAESIDGKSRTLDWRAVYLHSTAAGYLYEAQLCHELTTHLGVEW